MYVLKMNPDKSLITTIAATIYQYDRNADTLVFLIPKSYGSKNLADCVLMLRYILPNNTYKSEQLDMQPEPYNNDYYRYHLGIDSEFTHEAGEIEIWLSAVDMYDNLVFRSDNNFIEIKPTKNIDDFLSEEDNNQLDMLTAKVKDLEMTKADSLTYDKETRKLQLTADGAPIGDKVTVPADDYIAGDGTDEWEDMSDMGESSENDEWEPM